MASLAALLALPALAQTQLTIVNFGGANGNAQKKAYFEPFEKSGAAKIQAVEYNGEQAKIKAMVETKKITWDVVEVESARRQPRLRRRPVREARLQPRSATRPTSSRPRCTNAASASSSGPR